MHQPRTEHGFVEFGADEAVTVLAGVRALILPHHREGFLGDRSHRLDVLVELEIEDGAHMQAAFRGVRIHGRAGAVFFEDAVEPVGVFRKLRQRHGAVFDKGDRLALLFHRHHDVEPGGAEIRDAGLQGGLGHLDHAAPAPRRLVPAEPEVGHQLAELLQTLQVVGLVFLGELDHQQRIGIAAHGRLDGRAEHGDVAPEADHGAVDQFDGDRLEFHQVLGGVHRLIEAAEMADAEHLVADQRPQLQFDLGGEGQRAFGAHQDMGHVVLRPIGDQGVEIVAADAALHFRETFGDFAGFAVTQRQQVAKQRDLRIIGIQPRNVARHVAKLQHLSIGKRGLQREGVVAHGAVAQRPAAAGIVAGHAADGGAGRRRDIHRKPQAVPLELAIEVVEHDAGLDHTGAILDIERQDLVQVFRDVDDDAGVDGLAALRGATATRCDDPAVVTRNRQRAQRLVDSAGHHDAGRQDLIE